MNWDDSSRLMIDGDNKRCSPNNGCRLSSECSRALWEFREYIVPGLIEFMKVGGIGEN